MRIGIFSDTYPPQVNGVVTVVRTLKTGLERRGHDVFILPCSIPTPFTKTEFTACLRSNSLRNPSTG